MGEPALRSLYGERQCDRQEVLDDLNADRKKWEAKDYKTARRLAIIQCLTLMEQYDVKAEELK